jgi:hypothetical protein
MISFEAEIFPDTRPGSIFFEAFSVNLIIGQSGGAHEQICSKNSANKNNAPRD